MMKWWWWREQRGGEMRDVHLCSHGRSGRVALIVVALTHEVVEVVDDVFELLWDCVSIALVRC